MSTLLDPDSPWIESCLWILCSISSLFNMVLHKDTFRNQHGGTPSFKLKRANRVILYKMLLLNLFTKKITIEHCPYKPHSTYNNVCGFSYGVFKSYLPSALDKYIHRYSRKNTINNCKRIQDNLHITTRVPHMF